MGDGPDDIESTRPEVEAWLIANNAADGTMPTTAATPLGRAAIARTVNPALYIVPLGSSMLIER